MNENKKRFDYTWVIIALSFLMVMISLGFASSTKSLFPDEIAKALGTERSLVSVNESFRYVATAVTNIFFGSLILKFGAKKLICAGFVTLTASMVLYAVAQSIFVLYLAGALLGFGFSFTTTAMVGYVVGLWCKKHKGTIMGAVLASNGIGGAIAIKIVGGFINPDATGSYRNAYWFIAAVLGVTGVILLLFFKDKKDTAQGTPEKSAPLLKDSGGIEFSELLRKPYFWGILVCIFFSGLILQGTHGIVAMHFKDVGIDYSRVTTLLSFGSLILAATKFLTGFLYDKAGLRITAGTCVFFATASCFILAFNRGGESGVVLALIFSVIGQLALPLETIMLPIYAMELCGARSYTKALGVFVSVNTAGYAVGAPLINLFYDIFGSYYLVLIITGIIFSLIFVLLLTVISAANRDKRKLSESTTHIVQ